MHYIEAILALFAIVDPVGNIPVFMNVTEHVPAGQRQRTFNLAILVAAVILLVFSAAGNIILNYIFHVRMADLQIAGGILLVIFAIDDLVFGSLKKPAKLRGTLSVQEVACVPLACPLMAGPGAMVTSLATWQKSGPLVAIFAIAAVFASIWLMMRYVEPIQKFIGKLVSTVVSKIMCLFIAAIGVHMIMTGLQYYFGKTPPAV